MTRSKSFERLADSAEITPWVNEIMAMSGIRGRLAACRALGAVLHALRDHLPPAEADSLGLQLPPSMREIYGADERKRHGLTAYGGDGAAAFASSVARACPALNEQQVERTIWAVFTMLSHHVSPDVIRHVRDWLPIEIRAIWNTAA
jgi:uncharacterized protein (DUF2267 family)